MQRGKTSHFVLVTLMAVVMVVAPHAYSSAESVDDTADLDDSLEKAAQFPRLPDDEIGLYLGWVSDDQCGDVCHGYYLEAPIHFDQPAPEGVDIAHAPITLTAGSSNYRFVGKSTFSDTVVLTQPNRQIIADDAYSYRNDDGKLVRINMLGHVNFREPGKLLIADTAYIPLEGETSSFDLYNVIFRSSLTELPSSIVDQEATESVKLTGRSAWGKADQMHKSEPGVIELTHATYSTCPPEAGSCAWQLYGNRVILDDNTGRGSVHNAVLWVKRAPVFYMPYFSFPITDERQSGFLFPSVFSSSISGFGFVTPYYLNLAPNYDMTLSPYYYERRGVLLNTENRYLTERSVGKISLGILPHDSEFAAFKDSAATEYADADSLSSLENSQDTRWSVHMENQTNLGNNWSGSIDYNQVSDDYYTEELAGTFTEPSSDQLLQEGRVNYYNQHWSFQGLLQNYQTLHPVDQDPIYNQYARLPELNLVANYPDQYKGLQYAFSSKYDYFYQTADPGETTDPTIGNRLNLRPGVSLPLRRSYGYVIPSAQFDTTSYQLTNENESVTDNNPANPTRALPLFSIDSGLYFQRDTAVFGHDYTQTLEPRLYYLYVPYRDQDDLPEFDTVLDTLDYNQLFQPNRFSSVDRIGDANQFSYGVTTRYIDPMSGLEKMSASLGNILYLQDREVRLCDTDDCVARDEQQFSPFVGQVQYHLSPKWVASGDLSYNSSQDLFENGAATLGYRPGQNRVVNVGYNYVYEGSIYTPDEDDENLVNLSQIHFSYAWPVGPRWRTLGSFDFDTRYGNGVSYLLGIEYSGCCWGVRTYIDRNITGVEDGQNQYDSAFFVQFVLKGLSSVGNSDPSGLIRTNVAGYQDTFTEGGMR